MPAADVDAARVITTLAEHGVVYVVVGGFALELWQVAVAPTIDIDITPERSRRNLRKLAAALNDLGAELRSSEESVSIPGGFTAENLEDLTVLNLTTEAGPLDITMIPAGTDGFTELATNSTELDYQGVPVPTADLADIARSKEAAGRTKDIRVLPAIRAHLERRS